MARHPGRKLMPLSDRIDGVFGWIKWPVAILSIVLFVPTVEAVFGLLGSVMREPRPLFPFLGGAAFYFAVWAWFIRSWRTTLLSTLEHELTHAVFAVLTMHRVVDIKTTWRSGGHVRFLGQGNWLITLAPYFFPTVCFVLMPVFAFLPIVAVHVGNALIGASFAYHVTSTMRETHAGQSDLRKAGFLFAFAFLPTANLICNGLVVGFSLSGQQGAWEFLKSIAGNLTALFA